MILSPAHEAARVAAARLPALQASFARLTDTPGPATIEIYDDADPGAGDVLVVIEMASGVGNIDEGQLRINLTAPIEGQIVKTGDALSARIFDGAGDWWADATVSDTVGDGEIKLQDTALVVGAIARITSAHFQG